MWLHPSSRAIRLIPQPSAFNRSIAATSFRISFPRRTSACEPSSPSITLISTLLASYPEGPVPHVARAPDLHVARHCEDGDYGAAIFVAYVEFERHHGILEVQRATLATLLPQPVPQIAYQPVCTSATLQRRWTHCSEACGSTQTILKPERSAAS